jgi:universal stress protein A
VTNPRAFQIRQVLFPCDFSPFSDHAFEAALLLAQHFQAQLHLLHIVPHIYQQEAAVAQLSAFAKERATAVDYAIKVASGNPAAEIIKHAEREKIDLIVMGTHDRTGLSHIVQTSVDEAVVRKAPCLVLTIRQAVPVPQGTGEIVGKKAGPVAGPLGRPGVCLICARPSDDLVCDTCKAHIRAEAFYRWQKEEKTGR